MGVGLAGESEHGSVNQGQWCQNEKGRPKYGNEADALAGDSTSHPPADGGTVEAQREKESEEDLQHGEGGSLLSPTLGYSSQEPAAYGFQQ